MPDSTLPRILILTSSTGGGHDSRAYSLDSWLKDSGRADVRVAHMLEESSWLPRFGVWIYNTIQRRAPWAHNVYWWIAEGYAWMQGRHLSVGRAHYVKLLRDIRPHLIISVHDCLNRGYFQAARETLGDAVRCCTYCGEWSGGFGFSRNWLEPTADLYISRTPDAQAWAIRCGMPAERCTVFRNLLPPRAFHELMGPAQRAAFRERSLGLHPDRFTLLLATGQHGANNHLRFLNVLRRRFPHTQAIVFCGRNQGAFHNIDAWREAHPDFPVHVEGFSTRVHELLQAADCVVSRGGSNTTAEALFYGCPIVFNKIGGVMPQERLTVNYFLRHDAAASIGSVRDFARLVQRWTDHPEAPVRLRTNLLALKTDDHPSELVDRLLRLAHEVIPVEECP